jgi:hypothetical protein
MKKSAGYARMWSPELVTCKHEKRAVVRELEILSQPGVYVLSRDDVPYYVRKVTTLRRCLWSDANPLISKNYNFWNYFSMFAIEDIAIRNQL